MAQKYTFRCEEFLLFGHVPYRAAHLQSETLQMRHRCIGSGCSGLHFVSVALKIKAATRLIIISALQLPAVAPFISLTRKSVFKGKFSQICKMKTLEQQEKLYQYLQQFLTEERLSKIEKQAPESSDFILPVMEDVYQFRNAAAIVRSVEACGFHKIVALEKENVFNPNLTVTKGAETWVEVEKLPWSLNSVQQVQSRGYKIVAVSPEKNVTMLPDFEIKDPIALFFGTEFNGVTEKILDFADETLAIPMFGFTQSFNVSVAAAICMYELKQKILKSGIDTSLSEEKLLQLKIRWAVNSIKSGKEILAKYLSEVDD